MSATNDIHTAGETDYTIGLIGGGNIAHFWAFCFEKKKRPLLVWNRNVKSSFMLQERFGITVIEDFETFKAMCHVVLLAVPDDVVMPLAERFKDKKDTLCIHHSGTLDLAGMPVPEAAAVIWPVYSVKMEHVTSYPPVPLVTGVGSSTVAHIVRDIASIASEHIYHLTACQKKYAHLLAVMTNNFMNHLLAESQAIAGEQHIDFGLFLPIIRQTVGQISPESDIHTLQTGPAQRGDLKTIQAHLNLINNHREVEKIYFAITESIIKYKQKNS